MTQVLDLLKLHPDIVAFVEGAGEGATERALRPLCALPPEKQLEAAQRAIPGLGMSLGQG